MHRHVGNAYVQGSYDIDACLPAASHVFSCLPYTATNNARKTIQTEAEVKSKKISDLERKLGDAQSEIEHHKKQIWDLEKSRADLATEVEKLSAEAASKETEMRKLRTTITKQSEQVQIKCVLYSGKDVSKCTGFHAALAVCCYWCTAEIIRQHAKSVRQHAWPQLRYAVVLSSVLHAVVDELCVCADKPSQRAACSTNNRGVTP